MVGLAEVGERPDGRSAPSPISREVGAQPLHQRQPCRESRRRDGAPKRAHRARRAGSGRPRAGRRTPPPNAETVQQAERGVAAEGQAAAGPLQRGNAASASQAADDRGKRNAARRPAWRPRRRRRRVSTQPRTGADRRAAQRLVGGNWSTAGSGWARSSPGTGRRPAQRRSSASWQMRMGGPKAAHLNPGVGDQSLQRDPAGTSPGSWCRRAAGRSASRATVLPASGPRPPRCRRSSARSVSTLSPRAGSPKFCAVTSDLAVGVGLDRC